MILHGDALEILRNLPAEHVQSCVTSPPYWGLRDYGIEGQLGLEPTPDKYVQNMVEIFREVRRVLKNDGTLWLNLGDSYSGSNKGAYADGSVRLSEKSKKQKTNRGTTSGSFQKNDSQLKPKDLVGIPWRVAFALQADGWYLRQDIIWHKPNPMPESVRDRCTKAHEYIFLFSKSRRYYFDFDAIKEPSVEFVKNGARLREKFDGESFVDAKRRGWGNNCGVGEKRNKRSVWTVPTRPFKGAHFATFPQDLIEPCVLAGCPKGGVVLDPFFGAGTSGLVAQKHGRNYLGIEINIEYIKMAEQRLKKS